MTVKIFQKPSCLSLILSPFFIVLACNASIPSLVDLAIQAALPFLGDIASIDKLNIPIQAKEQLTSAKKEEEEALIKWSDEELLRYSVVSAAHKYLFNQKQHAINNSEDGSYDLDKISTQLPTHPHFPNRYHEDKCDDELGYKPVILNSGHFFAFTENAFSFGFLLAESVYFASIGKEKGLPTCLIIHYRDSTDDNEPWYPDTSVDAYSLTEFKNKPWGSLNIDSSSVFPGDYSAETESQSNYSMHDTTTKMENEDPEFWDLMHKIAPKPEDEYKKGKVLREEKQKKKDEINRANAIIAKNRCTQTKLTVYKIINDLPIPASHADEIEYTGTIKLNIDSKEREQSD